MHNWSRSSKNLGRSNLDPGNVSCSDNGLLIKIPAHTLDGGEVESQTFFDYGRYRARLKVPDAPSSITGFFLYRTPDYASEVDVEIYNDRTGRVLLTTYADGDQTNSETIRTGFDPTAQFHEYGFDFYPDSIAFYLDEELVTRCSMGLPRASMKLFVNVWFPKWLAGIRHTSDRYASVEWIRYCPGPT